MTTTIKAPPKTKTQLVAALREIIETPDHTHSVAYPGQGYDIKVLVDIERLKALLPQPKAAVPDGDRDGVTYDPEADYERLNRQMQHVWRIMRDGNWRTLKSLAVATGFPEASVSARLRDLRKPKFGEQEVQRKRLNDKRGTWVYRVAREQ